MRYIALLAALLIACDPEPTEGPSLECAAVACEGALSMCCLTEGDQWSCWLEDDGGAVLRCGDFCDLDESRDAEAIVCG